MPGYKVRLARSAADRVINITSKDDARRVASRLQALQTFPYQGAPYDPAYAAARPPHPVRATFAGRFGIYYTVDDNNCLVNVEYIEDCRMDPTNRFVDNE